MNSTSFFFFIVGLQKFLEVLDDPSGDHAKPSALLRQIAEHLQRPIESREFAQKLDHLDNFNHRDKFVMPQPGRLPNGKVE
jgi:hypothetical protein